MNSKEEFEALSKATPPPCIVRKNVVMLAGESVQDFGSRLKSAASSHLEEYFKKIDSSQSYYTYVFDVYDGYAVSKIQSYAPSSGARTLDHYVKYDYRRNAEGVFAFGEPSFVRMYMQWVPDQTAKSDNGKASY